MCKPNYASIPLCCDCAGDLLKNDVTGECECPPGQIIADGKCECPPGKILVNGECECPPDQILVDGMCECPPDQTLVDGKCECPPDQTLVDGKCKCPPDQILVDGKCECPQGKTLINGKCENIPCGRDQDVIFVLDASTSFSVGTFIGILESFQYIFASLKKNGNNMKSELILYPIENSHGYTGPQDFINEGMTCEKAAEELEGFAKDIPESVRPLSRITRADIAMEYLEQHMSTRSTSGNKLTTVITITDGPSDEDDKTHEELVEDIKNAINGIKSDNPSIEFKFLSVGAIQDDVRKDPTGLGNKFTDELETLADSDPNNYVEVDNVKDLSSRIISILQNNNILCDEQGTYGLEL